MFKGFGGVSEFLIGPVKGVGVVFFVRPDEGFGTPGAARERRILLARDTRNSS